MVTTGKSEAAKWGWLSITVTVLGVAIFTVPWIPDNFKILLAIPVYAMFFYVYYKYLHLRKMSKAKAGDEAGQVSGNRAARRQAERQQSSKKAN